ncbi:MAG: hypothetical protein IPJ84_10565 [Bdellovibrionales bacterium]|nr:hypothetical protein [Bdellovibrionales bacterium]
MGYCHRTSITLLLLCASLLTAHSSHGSSGAQPFPTTMKYFVESIQYELSEQTQVRLDTIAASTGLTLYKQKRSRRLDAILSNSDVSKAILVSVNRRVNPEYLNKILQHPDGYLIHTTIGQQQVALFFYGFRINEVRTTTRLRYRNASLSWRSLLIDEAHASSESIPTHPTAVKSSSAKTLAHDTSPLHQILLGDGTPSCGNGIRQGFIDASWAPILAVKDGGTSLYSLVDSPRAWWQRSIDDLKKISAALSNFSEVFKREYAAFLGKTQDEKDDVICKMLGPGIVTGVIAKAAKLPEFLNRLSPIKTPPPTAVPPELKTLAKLRAKPTPTKNDRAHITQLRNQILEHFTLEERTAWNFIFRNDPGFPDEAAFLIIKNGSCTAQYGLSLFCRHSRDGTTVSLQLKHDTSPSSLMIDIGHAQANAPILVDAAAMRTSIPGTRGKSFRVSDPEQLLEIARRHFSEAAPN